MISGQSLANYQRQQRDSHDDPDRAEADGQNHACANVVSGSRPTNLEAPVVRLHALIQFGLSIGAPTTLGSKQIGIGPGIETILPFVTCQTPGGPDNFNNG